MASPCHATEVRCGELFFKDLCAKLEKMLKCSKSQQKLKLIFTKELKNHVQGQSLFPLLRLLLPLNDTGRQKYGLKQAVVATTYIKALGLDDRSADASRLKFWKNPTKLNATVSRVGSGDFCSILEDVLRARISMDHSSHTIAVVNQILDDLAQTAGQKEKVELIRSRILNSFSPVEQKWLMRIVFQDMKIGLKYELVLDFLAPNALQRYNECADLRKVCAEIASGSLGQTATSSADDPVGPSTGGISTFTCFHPMLAKGFPNTGQIVEVERAMKGHPFLMDLKLDGERMLCHVADGKGMFWSRNGNDYSNTYRSLCDDVVASVNCTSCILDGEVCAWDEDSNVFIPFGHNRTVARMEDDKRLNTLSGYMDDDDDNGAGVSSQTGGNGGNCRLIFVIFDVLFVEGLLKDGRPVHDVRSIVSVESVLGSIASLTEDCRRDCIEAFGRSRAGSGAGEILHLPLCVRRALVPHVVRMSDKRIQMVRSEGVYTCVSAERKRRLEVFFNTVSAAGEEGLVVKDGFSPYLLGMRSRQALFWVKMKPEYSDMTRDLDLIVLGAYYGEGQSMRGKGLSTFLLGVRDDSASPPSTLSSVVSSQSSTQINTSQLDGSSSGGVKYRSLCKVGTGYNFAELEALRSKLQTVIRPWNTADKQRLPPHFSPWRIGKNDDVPDVWIFPTDSVVVELKCAEIVQSTQFSAGITCRFPRLRKIRYDKNVEDVMSLSDVEEVMRNPRLNTTEAATRREAEGGRKARGGVKKKVNAAASLHFMGSRVAKHFMVPKLASEVKTVGCYLADMVFCVLENEYRIPLECNVTAENGSALLLLVGKDGKITREKVIGLIQSNGGVVVASPVPDVIIVTGDKRTLQSKSMIESGKNDVVHFRYIVDLITGACDGVPKPSHLLGLTEGTKKLFEEQYDYLGDSFVELIQENTVQCLFRQMDDMLRNWEDMLATQRDITHSSPVKKRKAMASRTKVKAHAADDDNAGLLEAADLYKRLRGERTWRDIATKFLDHSDNELLFDSLDGNEFWRNQTLIYVDIYDDLGEAVGTPRSENVHLYREDEPPFGTRKIFSSRSLPAENTKMLALLPLLHLHGAFVSRDLTAEVTHVVVDPNDLSRATSIQDRLRELRLGSDYRYEKRVVSPDWVHRCIKRRELVLPTREELVNIA